MGKADFLYFEVEPPPPMEINLIKFRDSSVTFSAKIRKNQCVFLGNKPFNASKIEVIAPSTGPFPIELHTKHFFNANK